MMEKIVETLDLAMQIITGPWDAITWIIVLMLGSSVLGGLYKLFTGKSFDSGTSSHHDIYENYFTDLNKWYIPWNIWNER